MSQLYKIVYFIKEIFNIDVLFTNMYSDLINIFTPLAVEPEYEKYHYFGEFGFFHVTILGALEKYFKTNNTKIIIKAHENFCKILNILFPNNIIIDPITKLEKMREYHKTEGVDEPQDSYDLAEYLGIDKSLIKNIKYISKPIKYYSEDLEKKYQDKKYILIFPRNRDKKFAHRNMTTNIFYKIVSLLNNYNYEIIIVGHKEEVLEEAMNNYTYVNNLEETIYLLNNTKLLIAPDSGFIDFGKNCGVKNILMIYQKFHINYHYIFSPFKSKFKSLDTNKKDFDLEITRELKAILD
jgi:hypothetical protein